MGPISGSGRSPGGGNGNSHWYSCLGNLMERGAQKGPWSHRVGHDLVTRQQHRCFTMLCQFLVFGKVNLLYVYMCMGYLYPLLWAFLPIQVTTEPWVEFPLLHGKFSLAIYFIHSSINTSTSISQFILPLPPTSLLGVHTSVLYVFVSISALRIGVS